MKAYARQVGYINIYFTCMPIIYTGQFPDLDELFPPRTKQSRPDDISMAYWYDRKTGPASTGMGFFTPEMHMAPGGSRAWVTQPFRMDSSTRDSV